MSERFERFERFEGFARSLPLSLAVAPQLPLARLWRK